LVLVMWVPLAMSATLAQMHRCDRA